MWESIYSQIINTQVNEIPRKYLTLLKNDVTLKMTMVEWFLKKNKC